MLRTQNPSKTFFYLGIFSSCKDLIAINVLPRYGKERLREVVELDDVPAGSTEGNRLSTHNTALAWLDGILLESYRSGVTP